MKLREFLKEEIKGGKGRKETEKKKTRWKLNTSKNSSERKQQ